MKTLSNNPATYKRREAKAPKSAPRGLREREEGLERFLNAPVSLDFYIDFREVKNDKK